MSDVPAKRRKGAIGRPTKCTPYLIEKYCEGLKKHLPPDLAAAYAGLTTASIENWLKRALEGEEPYATFATSAARARAEAAANLTTNIQAAADEDPRYWRASAWLLEHVYSRVTSQPAPMLQSGDGNRPAGIVIDAADLEQEKLILDRIGRISDDLDRARLDGSHGPALQLSRDLDKAMAELAAARRAKTDPSSKDEASFLADLEAAAEGMPETHLRVFVDCWLRRHRCRVVPEDPPVETAEEGS